MKWSLLTAALLQLGSPTWILAANNHVSVRDVSSILKREPAMEHAVRSVVHISYILPKVGGAQGSGFFVSPNHILTALHVVALSTPGANSGGCDPSNCPDLHPNSNTAPNVVPCEKLMIAGVYTHGRSTRGRSFKCRQYVFTDAEADAVLIETIGSNDNWLAVGNDNQIDGSKTIDLMGYPGGNWFLHSRECVVTEPRLSGPLKYAGKTYPGNLFFSSRCVSDHGNSGGPAIVTEGQDQFAAVGILHGGVTNSSDCTRVPDLVQRHPSEFQAVAAAAGGNPQ